MATQGTHADLVARLTELASRSGCDSPVFNNCVLDGAPVLDMCLPCTASRAADALAALPPPADPPHDCEAWRLEGLGCAQCNKVDPPALVALVREWQRKQRGCDIENTAAAYAELDIAEAELLAYPLPAAPPVTDTVKGSEAGQELMRSRVVDVLTADYPDAARLVAKLPIHGDIAAAALADAPMRAFHECPTCGGSWPCDRCTTRAVDLDRLKHELGKSCAVCSQPIIGTVVPAWDGAPLHEGCAEPPASDDYQRGKRDAVRVLANATKKRLTDDSVASLVAALTAADAPTPAPVADESAWLIERDIDSVLHYWTGRVIDGREIGAWSPNHLDARRFARREDAAFMLTWHCSDVGRVAEHMWTPLRPPVTDTPQGQPFDLRVAEWLTACFGTGISGDVTERNHRFLEEALELVQTGGCTAREAHMLVDYVYGRQEGEANQEAGGVMLTLAALCMARGIDMAQAGEDELRRVWTKIDVIRKKQAEKPQHSPQPAAPAVPPQEGR